MDYPTLTKAGCPQTEDGIHQELSNLSISNSGGETRRLAEDMQRRCKSLLEELQQFQLLLKGLKKETRVEIKGFKGGLTAEMKALDKVGG